MGHENILTQSQDSSYFIVGIFSTLESGRVMSSATKMATSIDFLSGQFSS